MSPTIFALSTASGKSGIAIIRVSGPQTYIALDKMISGRITPRVAHYAQIKHPETGQVLDKGLILYFKGPHSFTGEDSLELHVHGGRAVIRSVMEALGSLEGFDLAEPGAFTRRAFHNGKLDLVEIEGMADLIDAETEAQRHQALRQLDGELSSIYQNWRGELIKIMALFEAGIDFVDEEDVPKNLLEPVRQRTQDLMNNIDAHLNDNRKGERLRDGLKLVILGRPNVGKSSLMNVLTRRQAAIVSDQAGTTRDVIETHLDIGGYPVILTDTAGIRETEEHVEKTGVSLALQEASCADLVLFVDEPSHINSDNRSEELLKMDSETIRILNKADLLENNNIGISDDVDCVISSKTGKGIEDLLLLITERAKTLSDTRSAPSLTRERHRLHLSKTKTYLSTVLDKLGSEEEELIAEDLRQAAMSLGSITGHVDVEDLLDVIFAEFCIGK